MVTHMKTTVEISDALLNEARQVATQEHTTLRALFEEGLRVAIEQRKCAKPRALRDLRYGSGGMSPEFAGAPWEKIRDAIYEGRGA